MATASWNPFGVSLDLTATAVTITRSTASEFTVKINVAWETHWSGANTNYGMAVTSGGETVYIPKYDGKVRDEGNGTFTGTYSISGNGAQTKTISVVFKNYKESPNSSATKTINLSVSVPAWTSYTVTYSTNGGTGGPQSGQTKWKDQTLTLSSVKPTRTGYTFLGWSISKTATSATYAAGGSYTANSGATLYAVWKANEYTVTYSVNGGTGGPQSGQKKVHDVTLKLSTVVPTRTNYNFLGWATTATATTAQYAAGANYTANAALSLYAVWELAYTKPNVQNFTVDRCNSDGILDDTGTYAKVKASWRCDRPITKVIVEWKTESGDIGSKTLATGDGESVGGGGEYIVGGSLSTESTYTFTLIVADSLGYTALITTITGSSFVIDIFKEGKGIAFNKPAELEGVMDIGFKTRLLGGIQYVLLESETDLNTCHTPGFYIGENVTDYIYKCGEDPIPLTSGTFTLEIISMGDNGQLMQRITQCHISAPIAYERVYYKSAGWGQWFGGWIYPELGNKFAVYASDGVSSKPGCRKDGRTVEVRGIVKPVEDIAGSTDMHTIITLPVGYRPNSPIYTICQGSGNCTWLLRVNTNGTVDFSRYRNGDATMTASAGAWLPFQVTYLV